MTRSHRPLAAVVTAVLAVVAVATAVPAGAAVPARAAPPDPISSHARAAVAYAASRHVTSTIAVIDTATGRTYGAGRTDRRYAAASTAKVFTAVLILARHRMTRSNRADMWRMITGSDNDAWHRLEAQVGWGRAITSVERRYHLRIGDEPVVHTNGGGSMVTALGMARMYTAIQRDRTVWPWLHAAMAHIATRSTAGVYQLFGIPAAHPVGGYALKQGWVVEHPARGKAYAVVNSTGYVDADRYVVCIYTRGTPAQYEGVARGVQGRTVTGEAIRLMPRGLLQ